MFVNAMTPEPFEISWWNFYGSKIWSKTRTSFVKRLHPDVLRCAGDLASLTIVLRCWQLVMEVVCQILAVQLGTFGPALLWYRKCQTGVYSQIQGQMVFTLLVRIMCKASLTLARQEVNAMARNLACQWWKNSWQCEWGCGSGEVVRAMSWRKFWNVRKFICHELSQRNC